MAQIIVETLRIIVTTKARAIVMFMQKAASLFQWNDHDLSQGMTKIVKYSSV